MKRLILIAIMLLVLPLMNAETETPTGTFTVGNSAPDQPTGFQVQDGASSWDSNTYPDTHDDTPNIQWTTNDDNGDEVTTYICIATSSGNRDSWNCDAYLGSTTNDNVSDATGINYSGANVTYYVKLIPGDGTDNGTALDTQFYLINQIPTIPSGLSPTSTHDSTPTMSWTATDDDDGSDDRWPADTLTYHVRVGTAYGDGTYENNDDANKSAETVDSAIPWGTPGAVSANNTVYVSIWTTDGNTDGTSSFYNTTLVLYDDLPDITDVEMTDHASAYSSCTGASCALTPIEHSNSTVAVRITADDTDDDCDTASTANIYLCLDTGSCSPNTGNWSWQVDSVSRSGSTCTYIFTTNKTDGPEFYRPPNSSYKLYTNVSSQGGQRTSDAENTADWTFGTLKAIDYPSTVTMGDGTATLGSWNDGTSVATMTNWGNDNLNISWQVTAPTSGSDTWDINGTDIQIDDDNSQSGEGSGFLSPVYLTNSSSSTFEPGTGLELCSTFDCNDAARNETLATYFHILPPTGLSVGTYNSTITITIS